MRLALGGASQGEPIRVLHSVCRSADIRQSRWVLFFDEKRP
jgi:hypothetical protein